MADYQKVASKRHDISIELLEHLRKEIAKGATATEINQLALAYRYLEGGAQPGSVVVEK